MTFIQALRDRIIYLDGAMGTELLTRGLVGAPEEWNITRSQLVTEVHRAYLEAGSDVVYANTFGANELKYGDRTEEIVRAGVECARAATAGMADRFVALDIGPTGKLLQPLGELGFERAVDIFKRVVKAGADAGADLIAVETMNDVYELKAAVVAAKEVCDLPVIVTAVFDGSGKTMTGTPPEAFVAIAEGLGASALGVNCSLAPTELMPVVTRMLEVASVPVIVKPNAGFPEERDGRAVYSLGAREFAADMAKLVKNGVRVVGGCCGTTPEYIGALRAACAGIAPVPVTDKRRTVACSYSRLVELGGAPVLIGERLNPTGKKRLKQALRERDMAYILGEAVAQERAGAHALDVNVGLPELDEAALLPECVRELQAVTDLPLQIDTADAAALERAMRVYNGVPLVNSVSGKRESMRAVFPLVKKYGGVVICLTLDEGGIPDTAAGRLRIAKRIAARAARYGIGINRLIFDPLAMAVSADGNAASVSIDALRLIRKSLGACTSLGISNISFGLPRRDIITSAYFALALGAGLSAAICDPQSAEIQKTYRSFLALGGHDKGCAGYIEYAAPLVGAAERSTGGGSAHAASTEAPRTLKECIVKGLKAEARTAASTLIASGAQPLDVINGEIIPALDEVGAGYENKTVYLPQLLMSAEAASVAFDTLKSALGGIGGTKKTVIVMATVKGDIHDIGKNIVCTLLGNYGFNVVDLGRDVEPQRVADEAIARGAHIVGLSALMTTTVGAMRDTVALLREVCPNVKICVGGAVLTEEYAARIGADRYCKDAMDTVRYAEEVETDISGRGE